MTMPDAPRPDQPARNAASSLQPLRLHRPSWVESEDPGKFAFIFLILVPPQALGALLIILISVDAATKPRVNLAPAVAAILVAVAIMSVHAWMGRKAWRRESVWMAIICTLVALIVGGFVEGFLLLVMAMDEFFGGMGRYGMG